MSPMSQGNMTRKLRAYHPVYPVVNQETPRVSKQVFVRDPHCFIEVPHSFLPMRKSCASSSKTSHVIDDRLEPIHLRTTMEKIKESDAR